MTLFSVFWTLQEFPETHRTDPESAESRQAQGGQRCLETRGGLPRAGKRAVVSELRLAACTRAVLPGAGAAVSATWCAHLRDTASGPKCCRLLPAGRGRELEREDEGETRLERWGVEKKRCKQIRQEKGTKGCPPSVTLRDKGPRTPHTCSHSGLRWGGDPNFLT